MMTERVRLREAARRLDVGPREVYERIDRGELEARMADGLIEVKVER